MEFIINHPNGIKEYSFPSSLKQVKLKDRVAFYQKHGKALDERLTAIQSMSDGEFKNLELQMWAVENATAHISFYCGIDLLIVRGNLPLDIVMNIFNTDMQLMAEESQGIALQESYDPFGNGEVWKVSSPIIDYNNPMTVNEFCTSKEIVRQMMELGQGFWPALPYLCAIFLRKDGEAFSEDLIAENGERMKLMQELPMDIAMAVAFFLSSSVAMFKTTSLFLTQVGAEV